VTLIKEWNTTALFDGGVKSETEHDYQVETESNNDDHAADELALGSMINEKCDIEFAYGSSEDTWKLQRGDKDGGDNGFVEAKVDTDKRLTMHWDGASAQIFLNARAQLTGAIFDFSLDSWFISAAKDSCGGGILFYIDADNYFRIWNEWRLSRFRFTREIGGVYVNTMITSTQVVNVKFRVQRLGATVKTFYDIGAGWVMVDWMNFPESPGWIGIKGHVGTNSASDLVMRFDDIAFASGSFVSGTHQTAGTWQSDDITPSGILGLVTLRSANVSADAYVTHVKVYRTSDDNLLATITTDYDSGASQDYDFTSEAIGVECYVEVGFAGDGDTGCSLTAVEAYEGVVSPTNNARMDGGPHTGGIAVRFDGDQFEV